MTRELIVNIHAAIGTLVFITGILQILMRKGGKLHRIIGQVYVYAWIPLLLTGAYIGGIVITIVGIFGMYYALTGARIGHIKNQPFQLLDKALVGIGLVSAVILLYFSATLFLEGERSFSYITLVFGIIFLHSTVQDVRWVFMNHNHKPHLGNHVWYFEHFIRMSISFIAATTAFTSIQLIFGSTVANFLIPTAIGSVFIFATSRYYKKKFKL